MSCCHIFCWRFDRHATTISSRRAKKKCLDDFSICIRDARSLHLAVFGIVFDRNFGFFDLIRKNAVTDRYLECYIEMLSLPKHFRETQHHVRYLLRSCSQFLNAVSWFLSFYFPTFFRASKLPEPSSNEVAFNWIASTTWRYSNRRSKDV